MFKKQLLVLIFFSTNFLISQTECINGKAGAYDCNDYDLMAHIDLTTLSASLANDSWGWTDPLDNKEYAIVGLNNGTAFIDISNPINPVYLGKLPTATSNSTWRDIKVFSNHAYIVSEAGSHGMQVFDLTQLRSVPSPPQTFTATSTFNDFGDCHNIAINEDTGYAYAVGCNTFSGGAHFINLANPVAPVSDGGYAADGYTHDAQIITYNGPDTEHQGKEIYLGCNENEIVVVDISNKAAPVQLSSISYSQFGYVHQGWFTEDQRYFLLGDETDELNTGFNTRTIIFDLADLDNPQFIDDYEGPTGAIDHNGYVVGTSFYQASYSRGMAVLSTTDVANGNLTEIGFFDTYTPNNNTNFNGVWNVYPFFSSGNIVLSDLNGGFFLVRKSGTLSIDEFEANEFALFPNPASASTTIKMKNNQTIKSLEVNNLLGQKIISKTFNQAPNTYNLNTQDFASGVYLIKINNSASKKLIIE